MGASSSTPNDAINGSVPSENIIYLFMPRFKMKDSFLCTYYGLCTTYLRFIYLFVYYLKLHIRGLRNIYKKYLVK
jgi:hypothetical protein